MVAKKDKIDQKSQISEADERMWALLAHLSILLNLINGMLGVIVVLVIYLAYKDRSEYIRFQALQAVIFQIVFWIGGGLLAGIVWAGTAVLSIFIIGIIFIPGAIIITLMPFASLIYGVIGGVQCGDGRDFRYWMIGDWVKGTED
jgi:uncharacterized Tic20 family protein